MTTRSLTRPRNKLVRGYGVNDAPYNVYPYIDGKKIYCKFYIKWVGMLSRCYSSKTHEKQPTYIDCTVCDEWHSFMAFRSWMIKQAWEGKCLDKDIIIPGNKIYSPETCCFVSNEVNAILQTNMSKRGDYPQGVYRHNQQKKYQAQINRYRKKRSLGLFDTVDEASEAYCTAKAKYIREVAETFTGNIKEGLLKHADLYEAGNY